MTLGGMCQSCRTSQLAGSLDITVLSRSHFKAARGFILGVWLSSSCSAGGAAGWPGHSRPESNSGSLRIPQSSKNGSFSQTKVVFESSGTQLALKEEFKN